MRDELAVVEDIMRSVVERYDEAFPRVPGTLPIYRVLAYHLGWMDASLQPAVWAGGKRFRPLLCLRSCVAAGSEPERAAWIAAAIELLHNFTLIHDDVQDRSETRRHRPTVWSLWGDAQAINAGDALFALSQLVALEAAGRLEPSRGAELLRRFNETTLRIVEGQVLDLSFEGRDAVASDEYMVMIERKTAALVAYAAWAGAYVAGAPPERAETFGAFGRVLGLGFQLQDDYLGVWGDPNLTGKARGDDLRRRKKSLPIVLLLERASPVDRDRLRTLWAGSDELAPEVVEEVFGLLERYEVAERVRAAVERYHEEARALLERLDLPSERIEPLRELVARLVVRQR
ncbi:MAG: polyprenyl synthetase family protein [Thermomicrobium sp.]|nr:polyprenyl synthetase family protein [Thermomicrobium sp.]